MAGRGAGGVGRHRLGRGGRPRLRQPAPGGVGAGRDRQQHRDRRRRLRSLRPARRAEDQPRVRLGQPHRPDPHRRHPLGRGRRRPGPAAVHPGRRGGPRVLLQRPRRPDRPLRELTDRRRQRTTCPRGRLRRRLHLRHRRPGAGQGPRRARAARRRAARDLPLHRRRPDVHPYQGLAARVRHRLRRLHPRRLHAHQRAGRPGHRQAARDRQHLREGRRNLVAHHRIRRRQRPGRHQE